MHILVTNDDGPPSVQSSPYIRPFVKQLQDAGHTVSVCLPNTQRSWIGKAHMIGQTLRPTYYTPSATVHGEEAQGTTHSRPQALSSAEDEEWVLVDGTPASCVQIGLYHFFQDRGPIELVVSGPNYGRNTTSVFALSSGTLGAALEAAVCKKRSIALSFAFFSRNHDRDIIDAACRHSVKVIEALARQWPSDGSADLYSVNVPLVEGVADREHKTLWADMLQNYWQEGNSCFEEIEDGADDPTEEEARIRAEEASSGDLDAVSDKNNSSSNAGNGGGDMGTSKTRFKHKHFKWAPRLTDVYHSVDLAGPSMDGRIVRDGHTCVTPMKANFAISRTVRAGTEFQFSSTSTASSETGVLSSIAIRHRKEGEEEEEGRGRRENSAEKENLQVQAIIAYEDPYVQPLIISALKAVFAQDELVQLVTSTLMPESSSDSFSIASLLESSERSTSGRTLQIMPYECIDFEFAASHAKSCLINSYMFRKALIRKHFLSATVDHWVAKKPDTPLKRHVKRSEAFEVDYAEFLDDALVEAFDLRESMERNAAAAAIDGHDKSQREWWILKPGMSDRGQGIRLFSTMEELQAIFDGWEAAAPCSEEDSDVDDDDDGDGGGREAQSGGDKDGDYITTSHLRHFVAQPYIHPPLLLSSDQRKFHIRTYVLCAGSLSVYVYRHMLALFAAKPYTAPWDGPEDTESFLTNTCLQDSPNETSVRRFWDLPLPSEQLESIFDHICVVTGEVFEAAAVAMPLHFQTLPNAFEVFGLDFMVDEQRQTWLLEVNAFPDFRQTGLDLEDIVEGFWRGVMRKGVATFFNLPIGEREQEENGDKDMVAVRNIDLGRR